MTLKTQMLSDLAAFFNTDEHAETATYNGSPIPAIVNYEKDLDERTGGKFVGAVIHVKASDVAVPAYRDTVVIGSDTWNVQGIESGDGYVWTLKVERERRPTMRK